MVYWLDFVTFSPPGFYGKDVAIDVVSLVVVLLIGWFSFKNFLLDRKNSKQLLLSSAFLVLAASFAVKIATNVFTHVEGAYQYHFWLAAGFLAQLFLMLFGYYVLYALTSKDAYITMNYVIMAYFILAMTYFARFNYHWFYLTAVIFLIAATRRYFIAYRKNKYKNTLLLAKSFALIALSQVLFIFTFTYRWVYMTAEIIQLLGYCLLAYIFFQVLKNARKKNKD